MKTNKYRANNKEIAFCKERFRGIDGLLLLLFLSLMLTLPVSAAELKNEKAQQEGNRLVITYDLEGKEKDVEVSLTITVEGKTYKSSELCTSRATWGS
jgi:hypothetical protein